jgi:hypothetical protein
LIILTIPKNGDVILICNKSEQIHVAKDNMSIGQ